MRWKILRDWDQGNLQDGERHIYYMYLWVRTGKPHQDNKCVMAGLIRAHRGRISHPDKHDICLQSFIVIHSQSWWNRFRWMLRPPPPLLSFPDTRKQTSSTSNLCRTSVVSLVHCPLVKHQQINNRFQFIWAAFWALPVGAVSENANVRVSGSRLSSSGAFPAPCKNSSIQQEHVLRTHKEWVGMLFMFWKRDRHKTGKIRIWISQDRKEVLYT